MKKNILFIFCLISYSVYSQDSPTIPVVSQSLFSLNFLVPAVEFEAGITPNTTLDLNFGIGFGFASGMYRDGNEFGFFPTFQAQYRYYYNLAKRLEQEKKISDNNGSYIAGHVGLSSGKPVIGDLEYINNYSSTIGVVWGLQRIYNSGFKLNFNLGAGYGFNDLGDSYISPLIGIQLGWLVTR